MLSKDQIQKALSDRRFVSLVSLGHELGKIMVKHGVMLDLEDMVDFSDDVAAHIDKVYQTGVNDVLNLLLEAKGIEVPR